MSFDNNVKRELEKALQSYVKSDNELHKTIFSSMEYSLMAGGKRLRPMLLLEFCSVCGGNINAAMPFACAIEMIHTYSLIHDDLPCMDNDDLRRGKPTNHKVFGDGMAVIAGDALQALAFQIMLSPDTVKNVGYDKAAKAAGILAEKCGVYGMCGGQAIDLEAEGKSISLETLYEMDAEKTGALILAAVKMGCVLGNADEEKTAAAEKYAKCIGLAFQIVDDLLDIKGSTEELGKSIGSDAENNKSTFAVLLGEEKSKELVHELTDDAVNALCVFGEKGDTLKKLAKELEMRSF